MNRTVIPFANRDDNGSWWIEGHVTAAEATLALIVALAESDYDNALDLLTGGPVRPRDDTQAGWTPINQHRRLDAIVATARHVYLAQHPNPEMGLIESDDPGATPFTEIRLPSPATPPKAAEIGAQTV